jgi:hypothetical protein
MTQQAYGPAYGPAPEWHGPPQEWYDPTPPPKPTSWWKRRWIWWTAIIVAAAVAGMAWFCVAYNTHQQELRVAHQQQVAAQADASPDGYTIAQEVAMVNGAEWHFCPEYYVTAR